MRSPFHYRRRTVLGAALAGTAGAVTAASLTLPAVAATVRTNPLPLNDVTLEPSRFLDNMNRTAAYLRFIDADRMLYTFRANHGLDTGGAEPCGGWEAPDVEVRGQGMGHLLTALAQAHRATGDEEYKTKGEYLVGELSACQQAGGFNDGYLSAFPEEHFDRVEVGEQVWAPWYVQHKIMAGLLDQYRATGNEQALETVRVMADWVDWRTGRLSEEDMQASLENEFGGMNEVLAALYLETEEERYLTAAQRFDHAAVFDPLAAGEDKLAGLHANTQMGKVMGAMREYEATGDDRYLDIAQNYWRIVHDHHTYANGGNSDYEHFAQPDVLSSRLSDWSSECCNTYNMLKLTRELAMLRDDPAELMDYYELALYNHILGQQDPGSEHGFVTYYVPLRAGGEKTYSDDYGTFWCCVDTGWENHTKFNDSIYFSAEDSLYVNLFIPSTVTWNDVTLTQDTQFPQAETVRLTVDGAGTFALRVRIPEWAQDPSLTVNGEAQNIEPGTYATIEREWATGDEVEVTLPMSLRLVDTPDDEGVQAVLYGPILLAGGYGEDDVKGSLPVLDTASIEAGEDPLRFTATANDETVELLPFFDTHHQRYTVYWNADGQAVSWYRLQNVNSEKVLGIDEMSPDNSAHVVQYEDNGSQDHLWRLVEVSDGWYHLRCQRSGKLLGIDGMSTDNGAHAVQYEDNDTPDQLWSLVEDADGQYRIVNSHSDKLLAVEDMSTEDSAHVVQHEEAGTPDQLWRLL